MRQEEPFDRRNGQASPLGRLFRETREVHGLSQRELGDAIGVSRALITKLENGSCRSLSPEPLMRFAKRFEVNPADLCAITGWMLPTDLPDFAAYLQARHPDWPEQYIDQVIAFYDFVKHKHSLQ